MINKGHEPKIRKDCSARNISINFFTQKVINVWHYKLLGEKKTNPQILNISEKRQVDKLRGLILYIIFATRTANVKHYCIT